jgi:predicted nucleotidyltransferase
MGFIRSFQDFPDDVRTLLDELSHDPTTESIWLIGSRANSHAMATSDWDFLIFSNTEPAYVARRRADIDLLRVGPSGRVLTDGGYEREFRDFSWKLIDDHRASYFGGKKCQPGLQDVSETAPVRSVAFLVYRNV